MTDRQIYLDHAATTPPAPEVVDAMLPYLREHWGNPSSPHARGRAARSAVDDARDGIAGLLGCTPREVTFTSGGSESDNLAIRGALERWGTARGRHIIVSAVEHEAVLATARALADRGFAEVTVVSCDGDGFVEPEAVGAAVRDDTVLVSVMLANNETGTIQDVTEIARQVHRHNPRTLVHTDAVQAFGRIAVRVDELEVDMLSLSAHKCYGPKGVGLLYARWGTHPVAQIEGGGQERGRRSGTENVAGIVGFAAAATLVEGERCAEMERQATLSMRLERAVLGAAPGNLRVAGAASARLPNVVTFLVDGAATDTMVTALDIAGVQVSGGSACSSGAVRASHVLEAMGGDPSRTALVRCSLGRGTTAADVDTAAAKIAVGVRQYALALR